MSVRSEQNKPTDHSDGAHQASRRKYSQEAENRERRWRNWMIEAQQGNAESYSHLLQEIDQAARRYVHARVWESDAAEDVVQSILLSVHKARHTYRPDKNFTPWFYAVARNRTIDMIRRLGRRSDNEVPGEQVLPHIPAHEEVDNSELNDRVRAAVASLPEKQKTVITLLKFEGYSVREISETLNMGVSAVKVTAHRGYKALRKKLRDLEHD